MSKQALLIIDYTNDFVADKGALTVGKPGQHLEKNIVNLADDFVKNDDWVILPTDLHHKNDPYHPETKLFPSHNLANTWGRQFYGKLQDWYDEHKDNAKIYMYDKTRYSAFAGTDLDLRLRERHIDTLHLVGVCTDICVLHTAIDAYNLNYKIVVHESGVAGLTDEGQHFALNHFKNTLGAKVVK
ncbi:cysteine hydrolase family protein [Apilactobacillus apisilvae]|uniref:Cysteine hydrolase family protein n=1 Tax=Apilactobacillus apisilvae TaxID=2923364 RepID=A0ABY4PG42_9LACO|nr:cysteine hydrolase family protein [Apilactobacillus apisilvae]UQS84770.1 cysteine hydrolase family protein [Apilactobacillus apisilvae]